VQVITPRARAQGASPASSLEIVINSLAFLRSNLSELFMDPPTEWAIRPHVAAGVRGRARGLDAGDYIAPSAELYACKELGFFWIPAESGGLPSLVWKKVEQHVTSDMAAFGRLIASIRSGELRPTSLE
jgi:hypothetical protein